MLKRIVTAGIVITTVIGGVSSRLSPFRERTVEVTPLPRTPLDSILSSTPALAPVVQQANKYELQIIYTRIDRDAQGKPHFTQSDYRLDERAYFNPASLVKLPVAVLSLQKLNQLRQQVPTLTRRIIMVTGVAGRCQTPVPFTSPPDSDRVASVGNYIKRMLLVSDNQAYNRLYEFLGQQYLHQQLRTMGYPQVRITRRFAPCDVAANRCTNPISFRDTSGVLLYQQAATCNTTPLSQPLGQIRKGYGYYSGGRLVKQPYDFTTANYLPLQVVHDLLKGVLFPEEAPAASRLSLTPADTEFLRRYLSATPSAGSSLYAAPAYFPAYKKYLYYGRQRQALPQPGLRIYNIVGMSHGYLADCAYFSDEQSGAEFMLSAVLYVNADGILNDGQYEYDGIGLPFLAQLGQVFLRMERQRPRAFRSSVPVPVNR